MAYFWWSLTRSIYDILRLKERKAQFWLEGQVSLFIWLQFLSFLCPAFVSNFMGLVSVSFQCHFTNLSEGFGHLMIGICPPRHTYNMPQHATCTTLISLAPVTSFCSIWLAQGQVQGQAPHLPIPKLLALKGSFYSFMMSPQIQFPSRANISHSVYLHYLTSYIK